MFQSKSTVLSYNTKFLVHSSSVPHYAQLWIHDAHNAHYDALSLLSIGEVTNTKYGKHSNHCQYRFYLIPDISSAEHTYLEKCMSKKH